METLEIVTEVSMNRAEAHNFFNRGKLFQGVGKTEHLFEAMLKSANSGRRMSIATLMNKYSWTERRAKDVIRYNCSASNMSASFDSKWVTISWK